MEHQQLPVSIGAHCYRWSNKEKAPKSGRAEARRYVSHNNGRYNGWHRGLRVQGVEC